MPPDPLILGVDEAGRGPAIGSLFIAGVALPESLLPELNAMGVRDSKKLSAKRREELYTALQELNAAIYLRELSAAEIDLVLKDTGDNLNLLEIRKMAEIINEAKPAIVYVDAVSTPTYSKNKLIPEINSPKPRLVVENRADDNYEIVAAASIVAKVQRDRSVLALHEAHPYLGDFGSGYPSDPRTQRFIQENIEIIKRNEVPFVRMEWDNIKRIIRQKKQNRLPLGKLK